MLKVATVLPHEPYREYKDVERVYSGSTEIDKILDKNGNVLFAVNKEVEGTPALTYKGKEETNLKNYRIYGQTVDGESIGDRTENLFDEKIYNKNVADNTIIYVPMYVGNVDYVTCSTTCPKTISGDYDPFNSRYIFILSGSVDAGAQNAENGVSNGVPRTIPATNGYVTIAYRKIESTNVRPWEYQTMLNSGSTALPYEPYGYKVPVTVEGKNLLQNTATSQTINGVTFTVNDDGSITCNGTAEQIIFLSINNYIRIEGNVILSGCPDGGGSDSYMLRINSSGTITTRDQGSGANAINPLGMVEIRIVSGYTCNNVTFYPMIRKADIEDDTYEPYQPPVTTPIYLPEQIKMVGDEAEYIDYAEQKQHRVRKNLINSSIYEIRNTGVKYTVNNDKSITANGGTSSIFSLFLVKVYLTKGSYIINGCPQNGSQNAYRCEIRDMELTTLIQDTGTGVTYSIVTDGYYYYSIRIAQNYVCDNLTFYPMIRKADISDDTYEPYIEDTEVDVTLPALPVLPGTNTLTVGTEVQPSNIHLKGRIKEVS